MANEYAQSEKLITTKDLMTTTMDYDVFRTTNLDLLVASVSKLVKEGYVPAGNVNVVMWTDKMQNGELKERPIYVQAIYKPIAVPAPSARKPKLNIIGKCPCCKTGDVIYKNSGSIKCQNKDCNAEFYQLYGQKLAEEDARAALAGQKVIIFNLPRQDGTARDVFFNFTGGKVENGGRIWMQYHIEDKD